MTVEHCGVLCELRRRGRTLIHPFRELSRTGGVVRVEVEMEPKMDYTFSWKALKPIDATCIVKIVSPKGLRTSVVAVVFMKSEYLETQICTSTKFMEHIDGLVGLQSFRCPRSDDIALGEASLEIWKGCSPDISKERPYLTFEFKFIKESNYSDYIYSDNEYHDDPRNKCRMSPRVKQWTPRAQTRSSTHEDTVVDTPLSTTPETIRTRRPSRFNPVAASQGEPSAFEPSDPPKITSKNKFSGLEIPQNSQLQSNDGLQELKESNDLLEETLVAESRKIEEEERALKLQAKKRDLERRKQNLNQERRDLEFGAPAQKRQKLSE